jgi:hypothetical protein
MLIIELLILWYLLGLLGSFIGAKSIHLRWKDDPIFLLSVAVAGPLNLLLMLFECILVWLGI